MKKKGARLGQHFLTNPWAAKQLVAGARVSRGDTVVEIGPGTGALTRELLSTGARVIAVEKDERLVAGLEREFAGDIASGYLTIREGDVRDFVPPAEEYILAANIPYYITGEIIRQFLTAKNQPRTAALLIQKEVADRIVARDGKESILSLSVKAFGTPRIAAKVSRGHFSPPPSVDSAVIVIDNISKKFFDGISEEGFFRIVRAGFSSKRKMLARNLSVFGGESVKNVLATCGVPEKARAEDLSLAEWKKVVGAIEKSQAS